MEAAFQAAKSSLASAATLAHPSPSAELGLMVDASSTHVGASLQQRRGGGTWEPLGFFSRKLNTAQSNYSVFDRELWAVFSGIRFFRFMLEGRKFTVYTDHKPLTSARKRVSEPWTALQHTPGIHRQINQRSVTHRRGGKRSSRHTIPTPLAG
jgi:hypothetical protein